MGTQQLNDEQKRVIEDILKETPRENSRTNTKSYELNGQIVSKKTQEDGTVIYEFFQTPGQPGITFQKNDNGAYIPTTQSESSGKDTVKKFLESAFGAANAGLIVTELLKDKDIRNLVMVNQGAPTLLRALGFGDEDAIKNYSNGLTMAMAAKCILGDPSVQFVIGKLGDVLWSFAQASQLSTQYADSTVQGREIARVTAKEEEDWTTTKWSQQVHAFLVEINKSAEGVLEAAKEEVKERTKVVIGVDEVEDFLSLRKAAASNAKLLFSSPRGYDKIYNLQNYRGNFETLKSRKPFSIERDLITRLATDTLDRDLTYAEWALMENVVKMEDADTYMGNVKTTVRPNQTQDFIKNNDRFLKAREIWSPNTKLKFGEGESMINRVNRLLPFADPEPITI